MFSKKGISLVTVLLFMLVATIAATATFKWLTSENRSSATRMQTQEARQSAIAGIQSTRAWMTNNANEVGALVRQYVLGRKQPILLNSRVSPHISSKQDFNVWLTGVSETNGYFKFKILSEGIARNNSKHTEAAIINVSGLYQVSIPEAEEEETYKSIAYDYSYFGGSISNHGDAKLSSMLINGNWSGNPIGIDKNIIITGHASLSGDNVDIYGTGCIGGNLYANNGFDAKNLYVHRTSYDFGSKNIETKKGITNHAYFDGVVIQSANGEKKITVGGNLTIKNIFKTHMGTGSSPVTINGNLCVDSAISQIEIGGSVGSGATYNQPFTVNGDVWVTHSRAFYAHNGDFSSNYNKLILGNTEDSKVYIPDAYPSSNYDEMRNNKAFVDSWVNYWSPNYKPYVYVAPASDKYYFYVEPNVTDVSYSSGVYYVGNQLFKTVYGYNEFQHGTGYDKKLSPYCRHNTDENRPECHVSPWFQSKGTVTRDLPATRPVACADSVKQVCYDIWEEKPGCDGASFKVDDLLTTAYNQFVKYADSGCAAAITTLNDGFAEAANTCYDDNTKDDYKKKNHMYNGYLVVKIEATQLSKNYGDGLKGKFIIIVTNKPGQVAFPQTYGENDYVFLYLTQGAGELMGLGTSNYNYFIYTKEDIGSSTYSETTHQITPSGGILFNHASLSGSVYAEVGTGTNCAKVAALTSSKPLLFNQDLMNSLTINRIICDASVTNCGGAAFSSSSSAAPMSSSASEESINGKDPYYISIAPQLNVTLESQYKATEAAPEDASNIDPSILVIPRIIYLSRNAAGKLADYYSVLSLNGANENKSPSKVSCNGTFSTTEKLYTGTELTPGTYTCNYASTNYGTIPFYVVVSNTSGELPIVSFPEAPHNVQALSLGSSVDVSVHIGKSTNTSGKIKFDVAINQPISDWTITTKPGVTARSGSGSALYYTVEVTPNATEEQDIEIFTISAGSNADDGDMYLTLSAPTELCRLVSGAGLTHHVYLRTHTTINRAELSDYCHVNDCDDDMSEKSERPDCEISDEWIIAHGTACGIVEKNYSWKCLTNTAISLASVSSADIPQACEIIIPSTNNSITSPVGGETKNLYASLKRKKVEVTVNLKNAFDKNTSVTLQGQQYTSSQTCTKENSPCTFNVLAGEPIVFTHEESGEDKGNFNYWACDGENCTAPTTHEDEPEFIFYGPHTITAEFNKESHCYYDDFANTVAFCSAGEENCIDTCATMLSKGTHCAPKNSKQPKSHWLMTYHNSGNGNNAEYTRPNFGNGSIYAPNTKNANNQSGKVSIILRNMTAGLYGTMFALVKTSILEKSTANDFLNSGLIFRSNGNEHLILNIFGVSKPNSTGELTFRVCKVSGQAINNTSQGSCKEVPKKEGSTPIYITSNSFIKVRFTIDEKDLLKVTAKVDDDTWEGELNVKDYQCNDAAYSHVGISLADQDFKIFDNGWVPSAFEETCWDVPTVSCNFVDKYEIVPLNDYVSPKVLVSSWFSEKNCSTEYYYNGCDNSTSECINGTGTPGEIGSKLDGETYQFTQEGQHGYLIDENKKAQDASIKVVCPGDAGSLDLAQDFYSCGTFQVGTTQNCINDFEIVNEAQYMGENVPYEFLTPKTNGINLREAQLHINIKKDGEIADGNNLGANLKVHLLSANKMQSLTRTISTAGAHDINVDDLIGTTGFNPEQVTKVIITSDNSINIEKLHIHSKCPNKLDLKCEQAVYDYTNKGWKIKINHQKDGVKCSYTSTDPNINSETDVNCSDVIYLQYGNGFANNWIIYNEPPTFTVTATNSFGSESCTIKGEKIGNNNVTCSVPTDQQTIEFDSKAPVFNFKFGESINGWDFNVNYNVYLDNTIVKSNGTAKMGATQSYSPSDSDTKPASGGHTYKVSFIIGNWTQSCTASFTVEDKTKQAPTISSCSVEDNGKFTAIVSNPDDVNYTYTFTILDNIGNKLVDGTTGSGNESTIDYTYAPGKAGTYNYTVKIGESSCSKLKTVTSPIELSCPTTITGQNASEAIVVSPTVKNCSSCSYKIFYEDLEKSSDLIFYDREATGTKQYRLQATDINDNVANCNFNVSFNSQSSSTVVLNYNSSNDWHYFSEGTYDIKCEGNGGRLVCKCPNAEWGYSNCKIQYHGTVVEVKPSQSGGQTVDGSKDDICHSGYETTITILPPNSANPSVQENAKQQGKGMYCQHSW
ncbi:pilus assembly PilX N-terminal domain-containing protein [Fibrobacter sp. UWB7]|uniref:pilus assembly PilX family protein n=1 Tax=Fibrobacter sp. UWB7 TaxID=1896206 RepID=UPI0009145FA1|nr:pilus assembly PilX N-terminal domain-containing protein [Fibrobacter sp. UWB7]SHN00123.1 hypothetical protein SAMN05720467_3029 [Fibrobacter sp. UWB7]